MFSMGVEIEQWLKMGKCHNNLSIMYLFSLC